MSRQVYIIILVLNFIFVHGQEKMGVVNSNFHPASSAFLNPSTTADNRVYIQVNLAGVNLFGMTNAAYIPSFSLLPFILRPAIPALEPKVNKTKKYFFANLVADGPSFFISKNKIGAGVFVRARSVVDARRMPYQFVSLLFDNNNAQPEPEPFSFRNAKLANMSWLEYGANFSYILYSQRRDMFTVGVNVKYLTGLNLQFLNFADITGDYAQEGITVSNLEGKYRAAPFKFKSGKGYAGDIGINYKKTLKEVNSFKAHNPASKCSPADYKYKLSLSLRDLGLLKYKGETSLTNLSGTGVIGYNADLQKTLNSQFSVEDNNGSSIKAFLPAAVTAQAEYNFENGLYANVTVNKGFLPNNLTGVQTSDFISFVPRFETRQVEFSLPFTLQRFMNPHLGMGLRIRSFTFGVDNVVPLVLKSNTSSVGVYFNLAFSIFRSRACRTLMAGAAGGGTRLVDACGNFKGPKLKFKRKNSLVSYRPLKEKKHRPQLIRKKRKLYKRN